MVAQNLFLMTGKGIKIYYHKHVPECARGLILISHGYGEHLGLYDEFMACLINNGYGVYAYDHRAHGRSEEERGHIDRFEVLIEDMSEVVKFVKREHSDLPLFIFGHSMGGLVAFIYGSLYPEDVRGQVFSGPAVGMPWGTRYLPRGFFSFFKHYFARLKIYSLHTRMGSRNDEFRAQLKDDPYMLRYATVGFFSEFINRGITLAKENAANYQLPVLFLHGKADRIIPYRASIEMMKQIRSDDKALILYEGLYHELVREPEREQVWQDILAWLNHRDNDEQSRLKNEEEIEIEEG